MRKEKKNSSQMKTQQNYKLKSNQKIKSCIHLNGYEVWVMKYEVWGIRMYISYGDQFESIQVAIWYDSVWECVYRFRCYLFIFFRFLFSLLTVVANSLLWLKGKTFFLSFPSCIHTLNFIFDNVLHTMSITLTKIKSQ